MTCREELQAFEKARTEYPALLKAYEEQKAKVALDQAAFRIAEELYKVEMAAHLDANKLCEMDLAKYKSDLAIYEAEKAKHQKAVADWNVKKAVIERAHSEAVLRYQRDHAAWLLRKQEWGKYTALLNAKAAEHDQHWRTTFEKHPGYAKYRYAWAYTCGGKQYYGFTSTKAKSDARNSCVTVKGLGQDPGDPTKELASLCQRSYAMPVLSPCPSPPNQPLGPEPVPPPQLTPLPAPVPPFTLKEPVAPSCKTTPFSKPAPRPPSIPGDPPKEPTKPTCRVSDEAQTKLTGGMWLLLAAGAAGVYFIARK